MEKMRRAENFPGAGANLVGVLPDLIAAFFVQTICAGGLWFRSLQGEGSQFRSFDKITEGPTQMVWSGTLNQPSAGGFIG
ncbi:hypothetical protein ATY76_19220 [Rhizobium sp. R339]|nr:hypothetical protein ATY76_19220 [Rhizobium sp. R339]